MARASASVTQVRPTLRVERLLDVFTVNRQSVSWQFGYGAAAAVTAIPVTVNGRPSRVTRSPTPTPSAVAKVRSITTPPGRTQLPAVSFGWSTAAGAWARPSACTGTVRPRVRKIAEATGYGPEYSVTPLRWIRARVSAWTCAALTAVGPAAGPRSTPYPATRSGPLVAARVCW